MKQVFCFLLVLAMMCPVFGCFAEEETEFSFRKGVVFGMSPEELIEVEGKPSYKYYDDTDNPDYLYSGLTLSGITKSDIQYLFKNRALVFFWIQYGRDLSKKYDEKLNIEDFNKIEEGLTVKYGEAEVIDDISTVTAYRGGMIFAFGANPEQFYRTTRRVLSVDETHSIFIEHIIRVKSSKAHNIYEHWLSYALVDLTEEQPDLILKDL